MSTKEQSKEWRALHQEHRRAYAKKWREEHKDYICEYNKKYQLENREKIRLYFKKYDADRRSKTREYYKNNKERIKKRTSEYNKRPERLAKWREYCKRAEVKAKSSARQKEKHQRLRIAAIEFYGGKCACCGETEPKFLGIDHIVGKTGKRRPMSGVMWYLFIVKNRQQNLQVLCHNCNLAKGFYGSCPHLKKESTDEWRYDIKGEARGDIGKAKVYLNWLEESL